MGCFWVVVNELQSVSRHDTGFGGRPFNREGAFQVCGNVWMALKVLVELQSQFSTHADGQRGRVFWMMVVFNFRRGDCVMPGVRIQLGSLRRV